MVYYEVEASVISDPGSPTPSDMKPKGHVRKTSIDVLFVNDFITNKDELNRLWNLPEHQHKIKWYKETYSRDQRVSFRNKWFADLKRFKIKIEFIKCFEYSG